MSRDPEAVRDLADRLLEARKVLSELEAQWEELFAKPSASPSQTPSEGASYVGSLADQIVVFLEGDPFVGHTADAVARSLKANRVSVSSILSRLVRNGRVAKRGYGVYGATLPKECKCDIVDLHEDELVQTEEGPSLAVC